VNLLTNLAIYHTKIDYLDSRGKTTLNLYPTEDVT